ncbi:MAG TPA: Asp23/Gls24 family envelope stress response protein [Clostridiaceae bacterium]|jgi:uncharacterized alkaline shock family protein YloU|nr:Asp23/Gls24 family envelope stress response protein [Clostridiaceae bacterium]
MLEGEGRQFSIKGERTMSQGFIAQYAAEAALHTEGVSALNKGAITTLKEAIGLEQEGQGVRVSFRGEASDDVIITVYLDVLFGFVMPEVAWFVQERVKRDVERYTGLNVDAVNVHVMRVVEDEDAGKIEIGKLFNPEDYL